jgi:L-ascorbate metabolism protein UlaG (beta-lactamase superfamily)
MAKGKLRFLGHSFFEFTTAQGEVILFDPWTADAGNPACPLQAGEIKKADLILASHDHFDHIGSALPLAKRTGAVVGAVVQTLGRLLDEGLSQSQALNGGAGFNTGGGADLGWVKVVATPAFHSSDTGTCVGLVVRAADGTTVYHAGDTGLASEMGLTGRLYSLDAALVPIGGVFTMDAAQAAEAVAMLRPKVAIPMHYASFPLLAQSAEEFISLCREKAPGVKVVALMPGETHLLG